MSENRTSEEADAKYHYNYLPAIESKILGYVEQGLTVREAVYKAKVLGYLQEQLIEKYERLYRF